MKKSEHPERDRASVASAECVPVPAVPRRPWVKPAIVEQDYSETESSGPAVHSDGNGYS